MNHEYLNDYHALKFLEINNINIEVEILEVKNLSLSNDFGKIDSSAPFEPFGSQPLIDSSFIVGHSTFFLYPINDLKINLDSYEDDIVDKLKSVKPISCPDANKFSNIDTHVIAKLDDAKLACKVHGKKLNYDTYFHENFIEGDVNDLADYFSEFLDNCEKGLHIWGGESSVQLPENPGRGGRNQQLALLMADKIKNKDIIFLSAGTDGTDGPTNDAGGLVDGDTIIIGTSNNLDHKTYIKNADSGNYLEKSDSLVTTGPTGTNVMDLILAIKK